MSENKNNPSAFPMGAPFSRFAHFAKVVWNIAPEGKTEDELAVADTCNLTAGCCKSLERDEIFELLKECI